LINKIEKAYLLAVNIIRARIPMVGAKWADEYFYLSPESSGTEGKWKCYPYQIGPLNWMTSDDIEEFNWMKSRRIGYTKCILAAVGYNIEQKNRNVAIWQPTDGDAKDFVTDEVDTMLRDVPVLGSKLKCKVGSKSKYNTIEKKVFHGSTLDIKGGKSARNFRRMTKDVAIYDETDGFDLDIDGEGSCFELGDGRLDQAPFPKSIRGSTPKTKGMSLIERAIENSERVFYRFLPCPICGALQRLEFSNLKFHEGNDSAHFVCIHHGCKIYYRNYASMDLNGRWQTLDGYYYDDEKDRFFDPEGNQIAKPRSIGARIWAAYSYLRPWSYLVSKWISANNDKKNGNITTLKTVINTLLGETFEERGESVNHSQIGMRGEDYLADGKIPINVLVITVGADIQGGANPRIEFEFVGWGLEFESWSLGYEVIYGDAEKQDVWYNFDDELKRKFTRCDGVEMRVSCAFIDSGYLPSEVYRFTGPRRRRGIYATKGVNTGTICNKGTWQGDKGKRTRAILRTVNVDDAKTIIYNRLRIEDHGPGFCHFPDHYDDNHFKKLTNEEKKLKRKKGTVVGHEWIKKGPNEPLDCRAYAMGALYCLNINLGKLKLRLERMAVEIERASKVSDNKEIHDPIAENIKNIRNHRRNRKIRGGFVNAWKR
jgi:phage terminase large subunit GpA-like protein